MKYTLSHILNISFWLWAVHSVRSMGFFRPHFWCKKSDFWNLWWVCTDKGWL